LRILSQQPDLLKRQSVLTLERVWQRHYTRNEEGGVDWRLNSQLGRAAGAIESPYDREARHSRKRELVWTGYKVHFSETCERGLPRLITNVHTTAATEQDVSATADIHRSLEKKKLLPGRHLVDAGYVDAELLVESERAYGVELFGPTRVDPSWQARSGGYAAELFNIDWGKRQAICPQGRASRYWYEHQSREEYRREVVKIRFSRRDCSACEAREKCVKSRSGAARMLIVPERAHYQALRQMRQTMTNEEGRREYRARAGVESTIAQAVRRSGARRSRYKGLEKTQLQEVATAAGINLLRTVNFLSGKPVGKTRISRFARLSQ
jgi:transposase